MTVQERRLFILLPLFHDGGVEQWAKGLIQGFEGWKIHMVVHGEITHPIPLPPEQIWQVSGIREMMATFKKLQLSKDDVLFTSLTPANLRGLLVKRQFGCTLVTGVQVSLMKLPWESNYKFWVRKFLYGLIHWYADFTLTASSGIRQEIPGWRKSNKLKVFWNPVISMKYLQTAKSSLLDRERIVLAVGRLERQKGFDLLLDAIRLIVDAGEGNFKVRIVGSGSLEQALKKQATDLELNDYVEFLPFTADIFQHYQAAKVFVLSSRYEGFGNVLAEAMVSNCYCVSYDINHGPSDILDGGKFGILVEDGDVNSLAKEMIAGLNCERDSFVPVPEINEQGRRFTSEYYIERLKKEVLPGQAAW